MLQFNSRKAGVLLLAMLGSFSVEAHPLDLGYFHAEVDSIGSSIRVGFELSPTMVERFAHLPVHSITEASTPTYSELILQSTLQNIQLRSDENLCAWNDLQVKWVDQSQVLISGDSFCPSIKAKLNINFAFLNTAPPTFQILGKLTSLQDGDKERSFLVEKSVPSFTIQDFTIPNPHFTQFIGMGIRHIGAVPGEWINEKGFHLPDGIDHIFFIVALILGGGGFFSLLKTATGFTIGHSVTLALASLNWVRLPSRWVESAIALSIVYVAFEVFFLKESKSRWKIAMAFGLVHGFGFASALQELDLVRGNMLKALVGFNFGVELGQTIILAAIVPVVLLIKEYSGQSDWVVRLSAASIAVTGSYWFVVRAFAL